MPVTLKGSTSGDVTLTAPAVAGTTTITLPATTGTILVPTSDGTSGQLLQSAGAGASPVWSSVLPGTRLIGTAASPNGGTTISFTDIPQYSAIIINFAEFQPSGTAVLRVALSSNNGSSYGTAIQISPSIGSNTVGIGSAYISNTGTTASKVVSPAASARTTGGGIRADAYVTTGTESTVTGVINAIQLSISANVFVTGYGVFWIYGIV